MKSSGLIYAIFQLKTKVAEKNQTFSFTFNRYYFYTLLPNVC
jgi:hypothetical protein